VGLVLQDQMSSNTYPWQRLQQSHGLDLQAVPYPDDGDWNGPLQSRLAALEAEGRRVALVAVPVYLWTDCSGPVDIKALSAICWDPSRRMRTTLVVDGTQSLGAVPFDVRQAPVDFLACSVHKWLLGAYGLCCLYVAPEMWADERLLPLVEDEHSRAHMVSNDDEVPFDLQLPGYPAAYKHGACRLDNGGRPNPILLPMAEDGLNMVLEWGVDKIAKTLEPLTRRIHERCVKELGLWVPPQHGPHFLGVGPGPADGCHTPEEVTAWARDAARFLKERRIYVTGRLKVIRVAPHVITSIAEVDRLVETLGKFVRARRAAGEELRSPSRL